MARGVWEGYIWRGLLSGPAERPQCLANVGFSCSFLLALSPFGLNVEGPTSVPGAFPNLESVEVVVAFRLVHAEQDLPSRRAPVPDDAPRGTLKPPRSPGRETPFVDFTVRRDREPLGSLGL
jgi:hypothetical protein